MWSYCAEGAGKRKGRDGVKGDERKKFAGAD